jgi:8-oxo-dGTP diphosphatase
VLLVVAAALVRDGRVLAARRHGPETGWEFAGGKVEPEESPERALERELAEELGVRATVGERLAEVRDQRIRLVLFAATSDTEPAMGSDHDALRWVGPDELDALDWLSIDRALLPAVRALLQRRVQA